MTTVRELAKLAGVSRSTVSRALTDAPEISAETRARILELAGRYQYRSNRPATSSGVLTIGFLLPRITSLYFARILNGVVQAAFQESCHVIPLETMAKVENTRLALSALVEQRVAGILIASGHITPIPKEDIMRIWSAGIVPIYVDHVRAEVHLDTVMTDWSQVAELAINYFIGLGHRYILPFTHSTLPHTMAMRQRLQSLGYPLIQHEDAWLRLPMTEQLRYILALKPRPTAVFTGDVEGPAEMVAAATRSGLRVPADLSVLASFNAGTWLDVCAPPITAIEQFPEEIGRRAFELLYRRVREGCYRPAQPETIRVPAKLVIRASCGPPRER